MCAFFFYVWVVTEFMDGLMDGWVDGGMSLVTQLTTTGRSVG